MSRGSELHVFHAVRLLEQALESEAAAMVGSEAAVEAAHAAEEALVCRYGRVSEELMQELARANLRLSHEYVV